MGYVFAFAGFRRFSLPPKLGTVKQRCRCFAKAREAIMNASVTRIGKQSRKSIGPVVEFVIERFGFALVSGLITYALYRMFLL